MAKSCRLHAQCKSGKVLAVCAYDCYKSRVVYMCPFYEGHVAPAVCTPVVGNSIVLHVLTAACKTALAAVSM